MKPSESAPIESRISSTARTARDQLGPGGEVDAVETRPGHRRAGDAHVHLGRPRLAQHGHDGPLGVAAHDRVVHHDHPLAGDHLPQRVQLEPDAALPDGLAGLDERPAHVGVLDQALPVGDAAGLGVPDGRRRAGLGHRDDQVGLDRVLGGQPPADLDPGGLHAAARDGGVRAGQVDVLEQAARRVRPGEAPRPDPALVDGDQLARLDLADERGAHDVQRRGLAGHHPAAASWPSTSGPEALRVAGRVQGVLVHEHQRVGAAHQRQRGQGTRPRRWPSAGRRTAR